MKYKRIGVKNKIKIFLLNTFIYRVYFCIKLRIWYIFKVVDEYLEVYPKKYPGLKDRFYKESYRKLWIRWIRSKFMDLFFNKISLNFRKFKRKSKYKILIYTYNKRVAIRYKFFFLKKKLIFKINYYSYIIFENYKLYVELYKNKFVYYKINLSSRFFNKITNSWLFRKIFLKIFRIFIAKPYVRMVYIMEILLNKIYGKKKIKLNWVIPLDPFGLVKLIYYLVRALFLFFYKRFIKRGWYFFKFFYKFIFYCINSFYFFIFKKEGRRRLLSKIFFFIKPIVNFKNFIRIYFIKFFNFIGKILKKIIVFLYHPFYVFFNFIIAIGIIKIKRIWFNCLAFFYKTSDIIIGNRLMINIYLFLKLKRIIFVILFCFIFLQINKLIKYIIFETNFIYKYFSFIGGEYNLLGANFHDYIWWFFLYDFGVYILIINFILLNIFSKNIRIFFWKKKDFILALLIMAYLRLLFWHDFYLASNSLRYINFISADLDIDRALYLDDWVRSIWYIVFPEFLFGETYDRWGKIAFLYPWTDVQFHLKRFSRFIKAFKPSARERELEYSFFDDYLYKGEKIFKVDWFPDIEDKIFFRLSDLWGTQEKAFDKYIYKIYILFMKKFMRVLWELGKYIGFEIDGYRQKESLWYIFELLNNFLYKKYKSKVDLNIILHFENIWFNFNKRKFIDFIFNFKTINQFYFYILEKFKVIWFLEKFKIIWLKVSLYLHKKSSFELIVKVFYNNLYIPINKFISVIFNSILIPLFNMIIKKLKNLCFSLNRRLRIEKFFFYIKPKVIKIFDFILTIIFMLFPRFKYWCFVYFKNFFLENAERGWREYMFREFLRRKNHLEFDKLYYTVLHKIDIKWGKRRPRIKERKEPHPLINFRRWFIKKVRDTKPKRQERRKRQERQRQEGKEGKGKK